MKQLVEVPLASGGSILVEIDVAQSGKVDAAAAPGKLIEAAQTMESALSAIKPVVAGIVGNLRDMKPDEVTVELGLGLSFGSDGVLKMLVASEANASFNVTVTWKKQA
ncbi:MAG: CU044_2847 family protein [Methanothrix sp.]